MKIWAILLVSVILSGCNSNTAYNPNYHILYEKDDSPNDGLDNKEYHKPADIF